MKIRFFLGLCVFFAIAPGGGRLWADKPKSAILLAELALLDTEEKSLPAVRKPSPEMGDAEIKRSAETFFRVGRHCHDLQRDYAEPLGKKADLYLRASLAFFDNPLARAYLGSSHLIQARDAASVLVKVKKADIGLREMDAAVKAAPADIIVRAIRIESTIELPSMFNRLDTVTSDLAFLLGLYAKDKKALDGAYDPRRLFILKAKELELRGKKALADRYRQKAAELSMNDAAAGS